MKHIIIITILLPTLLYSQERNNFRNTSSSRLLFGLNTRILTTQAKINETFTEIPVSTDFSYSIHANIGYLFPQKSITIESAIGFKKTNHILRMGGIFGSVFSMDNAILTKEGNTITNYNHTVSTAFGEQNIQIDINYSPKL